MTGIDDITINGLTQIEISHILFKLMDCRCDTCKSISRKIADGMGEITL